MLNVVETELNYQKLKVILNAFMGRKISPITEKKLTKCTISTKICQLQRL
jgi:hypothetical protein